MKSSARAAGTQAGYIESTDFVRLSEVSMTWNVPAAAARIFKTGGMSLTLAGRNLGLWTKYSGFDPEVISNLSAGNTFTVTDFLTNPPSRTYTLRVNFNF